MDTPSQVGTTDVPPKKRSRLGEYMGVLVIIVVIVLAAFYQEQILAFFRLHMWDRDAPARTVTSFLNAGKNGDRAGADACMGTKDYQPLEQNGRWVGYFIVSQAGRLDIPFSDLAPAGDPKPTATDFVTMGTGAAEVTVPNASGTPIKYRLELQGDQWKIKEIRGGHVASPSGSSGNSGGGGSPKAGARRSR